MDNDIKTASDMTLMRKIFAIFLAVALCMALAMLKLTVRFYI